MAIRKDCAICKQRFSVHPNAKKYFTRHLCRQCRLVLKKKPLQHRLEVNRDLSDKEYGTIFRPGQVPHFIEYVSQCCGSRPAMEIDINTLTGFCGHYYDKAVFITEDEYEGIDKKSDKV